MTSPSIRARRHTLLAACTVVWSLSSACSTQPPAPQPAETAQNGASTAASAEPSPAATPSPAAEPAPAASALPSAAASAEPPPEPTPAVTVKNIGMHVGGGKNDAPEKAPIKRSVEPHFAAFAQCFAKADDLTKTGDFGVDLRIERDGGKAAVSHPRTAIKGDDFKACVLAVFEAIDFERPKGGTTTVSYSLRFTPDKPKR